MLTIIVGLDIEGVEEQEGGPIDIASRPVVTDLQALAHGQC